MDFTLIATVVTGLLSWFQASRPVRQKAAADAARDQLRWVAGIVVKQIETTVRVKIGGQLSPKEAADLLTMATNRALALLKPKRAQIEKALGVDLVEVIRAELEIALAAQRRTLKAA